MSRGPNVSPVVAGIVIAIVVVIAGVLVYRATGSRGRATIPPEQAQRIRESLTGSQGGHSGPPAFIMNGGASRR